jgi:Ca2+-binding EF-hand superfamily protein
MIEAKELSRLSSDDLSEAFLLWDIDGVGWVSPENFHRMLRGLGFHLVPEEIDQLLTKYPTEIADPKPTKALKVFKDQFVLIGLELMSRLETFDMILNAFKKFDPFNTGFIDHVNLTHVLMHLGPGEACAIAFLMS